MLRNVPHGSRCAALLACPRAPQRLGARPAAPRPGGVPPLVAARPRVTRRPVRDAAGTPGRVWNETGPPRRPRLGPGAGLRPACAVRLVSLSGPRRGPGSAAAGAMRRAGAGSARGGSRVVGRGPGALPLAAAVPVACAYIKRLRRKPGDCIQRVVILRFATVISTPRSSRRGMCSMHAMVRTGMQHSFERCNSSECH